MKKTLSNKLVEKLPNRHSFQRQWSREGQVMFGQPDWFQEKKFGWGLKPVTWQGWAYTAAWSSVMLIPFLTLLSHSLVPEAVVWVAASIGMLTWDVSKVLRLKRSQTPALFAETIYPDEQSSDSNSTRFDRHVRY